MTAEHLFQGDGGRSSPVDPGGLEYRLHLSLLCEGDGGGIGFGDIEEERFARNGGGEAVQEGGGDCRGFGEDRADLVPVEASSDDAVAPDLAVRAGGGEGGGVFLGEPWPEETGPGR